MKSHIAKITILHLIIAGLSFGQVYWNRDWGGWDPYPITAIVPSLDGNYIVAGNAYSSQDDILLKKISYTGDFIWTKTYGEGDTSISAGAVTSTASGDFIIVGEQRPPTSVPTNLYALRINPNGDVIWTKVYKRDNFWMMSAIMSTNDGNFIAAGNIFYGIYILKIKPDGDTMWTKTFSFQNENQVLAMTKTPEGDFILAGYITSSTNAKDVYLLKISNDGDSIWSKTYGGADYDYANAITPTPDGNFIVAGNTGSFGSYSSLYFLKIKPDGDTVWTKTYPISYGSVSASAIIPTQDGNFLAAEGPIIIKIKPNGDTIWSKAYYFRPDDAAAAMVPAQDGNFILAAFFGECSSICLLNGVLFSIIDDRYAYKNIPFSFKIPVSGDSTKYTYTPLETPAGMAVSAGGTISWTPTTDSVYMDHVEFAVSNGTTINDTLTFNIFVNNKNAAIKDPHSLKSSVNRVHVSGITVNSFSSYISFTIPNEAAALAIYDIRGNLVAELPVINNTAVWRGQIAAGRYFARAADWKKNLMRSFVVVR